jgi:hypothetical protein
MCSSPNTRWFKYDRDYLCVKKSQFVPVIFEPPYIMLVIQKKPRDGWTYRKTGTDKVFIHIWFT